MPDLIAKQKSKIILIYAEETIAPDGTITIKPFKTLVPDDMIPLSEASKITSYSVRHLTTLCQTGVYKSARRRGPSQNAQWMVSRAELLTANLAPAE